MKRKKTQSRFLEPFSPTIMESTVPKRFVDIVNDTGDIVLSDEQKSVKWDWSHKLVGKVSKEVQIPVSNSDDIVSQTASDSLALFHEKYLVGCPTPNLTRDGTLGCPFEAFQKWR